MRIICFGDSLTWGGYGASYVDVLRELRPEDEIINAGVGGDTVINLERRMEAIIEQEPDLVFMMIGGNDAISNLYPDTRVYYRSNKKIENGVVMPDAFREAYRRILMRFQLNFISVLVGLPPVEYSLELVKLLASYNQIAEEEADRLRIPTLDLARLVPAKVDQEDVLNLAFIQLIGQRELSGWDDFEAEAERLGYEFTFDGLHLLDKTATLLAKAIDEAIQDHS